MNIAPRPGTIHEPDAAHAVAVSHEAGAFTVGSTMRHVLVMTAAGSAGLVAVFLVDFLTLLYISRLGDMNLTAAVGYASQMFFVLISVNIGLSIAISALVSRAIGSGDRAGARRIAASGLVLTTLVSGVLSLGAMPFATPILATFGAKGEALAVGAVYLRMTLPAMAFLGLGMALSSILRGVGDARRAMYVTLSGAIVTAILDPIFIFVLHLGVYGAAIVLVISRFCLLLIGGYGAVRVHDLVARPRLGDIAKDVLPLAYIAGPAIATNVATPIANIYVMRVFSQFGDAVIASFAIMDRVTPVAFGVLFALSGSIGPILGQNFGAQALDRVRGALTNSYIVAAIYVLLVTALLWAAAPLVILVFGAKGETAELLRFFCRGAGVLWFFLGGVFVANAACNNLGWPILSALFNWGRATLGTIPFVTIGARHAGPEGGFIGIIVGAALFGCVAVAGSYLVVGRLAPRPTSG